MRLIDADAFKEYIKDSFEDAKGEFKTEKYLRIAESVTDGFLMDIDEAPTVEAKPVVHGSWETEFTALLVVYRCSECNCATALGQTNFCPNCGADMRGGKNE